MRSFEPATQGESSFVATFGLRPPGDADSHRELLETFRDLHDDVPLPHNARVTTHLGAEAILKAATKLFAERGIDGVTLVDIQKASGHRNRSAIGYHFGGKDELVEALITSIVDDHDRRRVDGFDRLDATGIPPTLGQVLEVALSPMIDDLDRLQTRLRLRMLANLAADERHMGFIQEAMVTKPGLGRSTALIIGHLDGLPDDIKGERVVLATTFGLRAFADQARLMDSADPGRPVLAAKAFAGHTIELIEALLTAPHTSVT